jgi:hypothetical protein
MTKTINKKEKEPKSIGEIIMPIVFMLLFFGIPIAYYWLEEEPREAAITAFDNGNTAKIQLVLVQYIERN